MHSWSGSYTSSRQNPRALQQNPWSSSGISIKKSCPSTVQHHLASMRDDSDSRWLVRVPLAVMQWGFAVDPHILQHFVLQQFALWLDFLLDQFFTGKWRQVRSTIAQDWGYWGGRYFPCHPASGTHSCRNWHLTNELGKCTEACTSSRCWITSQGGSSILPWFEAQNLKKFYRDSIGIWKFFGAVFYLSLPPSQQMGDWIMGSENPICEIDRWVDPSSNSEHLYLPLPGISSYFYAYELHWIADFLLVQVAWLSSSPEFCSRAGAHILRIEKECSWELENKATWPFLRIMKCTFG